MAKFTDNGTSTTVPLTVSGAWQHVPNPSACFAVNDHIEFNFDGVVRTVTAVDSTTNHTITFTPALSQVPGGGNGLPTVPRDDVVEDWGPNVSSFVRNSALASGSPGQTMSASGGPIGSLINLSQYQADDFLGTGESDVPPMPADVQANLQQHNWHIATWFSFGD